MSKKSIYRKVFDFSSGGILAVLVNALAYPILTHFYTPEEYGDYGLFLFFSGVFSAVASLKFELVVPIQRDDGALSEVLTAAAYNVLLVSVLSFAVSLAYYWFEERVLSVFVVSAVVLYGWFTITGGVLVYFHSNKAAGSLLFVQALIAVVVQIAFSDTKFGWYGLVIGYLASMVVSSFFGLLCIWKVGKGKVCFSFLSKNRYIEILSENKNRWRANVVQTLMNAVSLNVLAHGCLFLGGKEAVGFFSFAQKILTIPVRVVGNAVRQVMLREYSITGMTKSTVKSMSKLTGVLALVSTAIFTVVGLALPFLVDIFLDQKWAQINSFIWPISIWLACTIVYVPAISALNVVGNNWPHTIYEFGNLVMRGGVIFACFYAGLDAVDYIFVTSVFSSALIVFFIFWVRMQLLKTVQNG
ncbi:hypothetical protein [Alcanivorax sp.]|uniref:lipopolysaccharide biosynthesis protein n=1 Tax=Alcanivorax sp. TaxID=1872427 RepID=UPI000C395C07|nr:hypothetical protein [Alcanivorax sp.]MBQ23763.1 hypothetical protein [Alcanivorax sp.]|tara:strand:+ start:6200 stop:7441 length:1242 start_codon:yes stop_codon:yes gene_type:complete